MGKKNKRKQTPEVEDFRWDSYFRGGGAKKFVTVGALLFAFFSILTISDWGEYEGLFVAQDKWSTTQGTIFHTWIEHKRGGAKSRSSVHLHVRYVYYVQGTKYIGTRIGFDGISSSSTTPVQFVEHVHRLLAVGTKPTVYYLKWKPQVSVLNLNHKDYGQPFVLMVPACIGLCIFIIGIFGHIKYNVLRNI